VAVTVMVVGDVADGGDGGGAAAADDHVYKDVHFEVK